MGRNWMTVILVIAGLLLYAGLSTAGETAVWSWRIGFLLLLGVGLVWLVRG